LEVSTSKSRLASTSRPQLLTPAAAHALRFKLFKRKQGRLFILAIDLSGSMALNRIAQAKRTMLSLLRQSYIERDSVAIVGFRGRAAELLLQPSRSILRTRCVLDSVSVGGGTPLSAGLACSLRLAKRAAPKSGEVVLLLFTDGHANVALSGNGINYPDARQEIINEEVGLLGVQLRKARVTLIVADTQNQFTSTGKARALAEILGAEYRSLQQHADRQLAASIRIGSSAGGTHDPA
jgi:magnesium chelatase subunit D